MSTNQRKKTKIAIGAYSVCIDAIEYIITHAKGMDDVVDRNGHILQETVEQLLHQYEYLSEKETETVISFFNGVSQ